MIEKIRNFVKKQGMLSPRDHVVVGVSGGADSVCLLLVLQQLQKEFDFTMEVVHVEHGIRGKDSLEDAEFVENLCKKLQIPVRIFSVDVPTLAKQQKCSLEETGRNVRYELFQSRCSLHPHGKIAVAHHKNDQAETVLFRMVRGSNLRGMEGMRPVEGNCIRPLLCVERKEIEAYLQKRQQTYRVDDTNGQDAYHRNRIRNQILPQFLQVNTAAVTHICDLAQCFGEAAAFIREQARMQEEEIVCYGTDAAEIRQEPFIQLPQILQKQVLYDVLARLAGSEKDLTAVHVEEVRSLFYKQVGRQNALPYRLLAKRTYGSVRIKKQEQKSMENLPEMPIQNIELQIPGKIQLPDGKGMIETSLIENSEKIHQIPRKRYTKWFDYAKINSNVQIRTRQAGDYLIIDTEGQRQSLKKYFKNEKIPSEQRDQIWLLACGSEILWVIGYRIGAAYLVTEKTKKILQICCDMEEK